MLNLPLGANAPLNQSHCDIYIKNHQQLGSEIGLLWLVMDKERKAIISPAYLHENKDWGKFDPQNNRWQLDLDTLFKTHHAHTVQLIAYAYDTPNVNLPAIEISQFDIQINQEITYQFNSNERHVKASIILEIYERNGQYKVRALAENSSQHLSSFAERLQISLDARHPTIHESLQQGQQGQQPNSRPCPQAGETWTGTAFAIDRYHLLTCEHVIDGATIIGIRQKGQADRQAQVVLADEGSDTALLKVSEPLPSFIPIRELGYDLLGESVTTLGFPLTGLGSQLQVTRGNIAGLQGIGNDIRYLQFTAPIQPGSSGSPLLLPTGEVIGMVTHSISNAQNMNYATKSQLLLALVASAGLNVSDLPKNVSQSPLSTPQLTKQSKEALWLVGCQA